MRKLWLLFSQATTVFLAFFWLFYGQAPFLKEQESAPIITAQFSYRHAVEKAMPAVVHILTTDNRPRPARLWAYALGKKPEKEKFVGVGSGIVMNTDGHILTNAHVIRGAKDILIELADGRRFPAERVASDSETDIAVLKINAPHLAYLKPAQGKNLTVGDVVLAIGNPYSLKQTATLGIVSALNRTHPVLDSSDDFIQTDAVVNPGNSGGALINAQGELVGMTNAIYSENGKNNGIAFSIPVERLMHVYTQLLKKGKVERGWMGLKLHDLEGKTAEAFRLKNARGVLVLGFFPDSPAEKAQLKAGDILLEINGQNIPDSKTAFRLLKNTLPGEEVLLTVQRDLSPLTLRAVLASRPPIRP